MITVTFCYNQYGKIHKGLFSICELITSVRVQQYEITFVHALLHYSQKSGAVRGCSSPGPIRLLSLRGGNWPTHEFSIGSVCTFSFAIAAKSAAQCHIEGRDGVTCAQRQFMKISFILAS